MSEFTMLKLTLCMGFEITPEEDIYTDIADEFVGRGNNIF